MTTIFDNPTDFAEDLLVGFVAANAKYVARVDGGVVRSTEVPDGQVAVIVGGGSGHYPAFAGFVGPGMATACACGNMFASPSVAQVSRVIRAADAGGGVLLCFGNYAGDVLHFGEAEKRLRDEGVDVRTVLCTDDIASAPIDELDKRRGIAGLVAVFKCAGAAAEEGLSLDEVERIAAKANYRTRTLGVAFDGCTLPGATEPLFTLREGEMSIGLGIHGEPGISEQALPTASELAELLVSRLLADKPHDAGIRVVPILNGLGTIKYEELFVLYGKILPLLEAAGLEVVEPECGELVTSLDMGGLSLSLFWLDEELEKLWAAPVDTPAFRKGSVAPRARAVARVTVGRGSAGGRAAGAETRTGGARAGGARMGEVSGRPAEKPTPASAQLASTVADLFVAVRETVVANADELGRLDAVAGDGDHGIGMTRGVKAATAAAAQAVVEGKGIHDLLADAAEAWSDNGGGTSGALWGAALAAIGESLGNRASYGAQDAVALAIAARDAIVALGKAAIGDKTMLDALSPFVETLDHDCAMGMSLANALTSAAVAATEAALATADLRPRIGRARPLAEKSLGHPDAGAVSLALIVTRIAEQATAGESKA